MKFTRYASLFALSLAGYSHLAFAQKTNYSLGGASSCLIGACGTGPLLAQTLIGTNDEPIKRLPYGGYEHDRSTESPKSFKPSTGRAETPAAFSWMPRPFVFGGPSLVGNGYQSVAANFGGGFVMRTKKFLGDFEASYMNARKTNDNTVNNYSGHERSLRGRIFYPLRRNLYVGGGAQWSETATTNYTKSAWRPTFGGGGDYFRSDMSARWQVMYITRGSDKANALQGPEFQLWLPSPASRSHFLWRMSLGAYVFHATITDPTDKTLTALQTSQRGHAGFLDFMVGWKF